MAYRGTAADFGTFLEDTVGHVGYLIGTRGQTCTQAMIDYRLQNTAYKSYWPKIEAYASQWIGDIVADCLGWFEMFTEGGSLANPLTQFRYADTNTWSIYALAKSSGLSNGLIATLPIGEPYPIAVGYDGHVGFYHNGNVYQSVGHQNGTIITALSSTEHNSTWQYWYYLPYLDYSAVPAPIVVPDLPPPTPDAPTPEVWSPTDTPVSDNTFRTGALFQTRSIGSNDPLLERKYNDTVALLNRYVVSPSPFIRTLMDDKDAASARVSLGISDGVDVNSGGNVVGPASAVDNNFAQFNGIGGKIIEDSGISATSIQNEAIAFAVALG